MEEVNFSDFKKIDIRIGTIVHAEVPEWSHWVMRLTVDFGEEVGKRTIFAGIMKFFKPEDLIGTKRPFVVNIMPKRIGPANEEGKYEYSQGMMLAAVVPSNDGNEENDKPVLLSLEGDVPNGTRLM